MTYKFSEKVSHLQASAIREILKFTSDPEVISFAAGNPSPEAFPVDELNRISEEIFKKNPIGALQYSLTEGYTPLRDLLKKELEKTMELLSMDKSYAERDLNVGFSGGEKKKAEILQLLMLKPSFAILDETDSGLDVDAVKTVSAGIEEYQKTCKGSLLIITHSTRILESLSVDYTHVMIEGKIISTGDASLVDKINENGFAEYEAE